MLVSEGSFLLAGWFASWSVVASGSETPEAMRRDAPKSVTVAAPDTKPFRPTWGRVRRRPLMLMLVCADLAIKNLDETCMRDARNCLCMRDIGLSKQAGWQCNGHQKDGNR